jgi:chemotaxis protein MotB
MNNGRADGSRFISSVEPPAPVGGDSLNYRGSLVQEDIKAKQPAGNFTKMGGIHMRKAVLFLCLGAALTLSGCVTTKTYQEAQGESEACRVKAEGLSADLTREQSEKARLKTELEACGKDLSAQKMKGEEAAAEKSDIEKRHEVCIKDREDQKEQIALLKGALDGSEKEKEYQSREIERLKVKSGEISTEKELELQKVKGAYENLLREMKQEIEKGDIKITQAVDRLSVNLVEKILFDSGEAEIKLAGLKIIKRVGDILKKVEDKQIRVEGHTDNVQIGARIKKKYPSNWELSTARATTVVRYLQDKVGISPAHLSAAGFAENKPVASNETQEGKAQNRRIEIVLLPLDVDRVLEELKK